MRREREREKPFILPNCDTFAKINRPLDNTTVVANDAGFTHFRFVVHGSPTF